MTIDNTRLWQPITSDTPTIIPYLTNKSLKTNKEGRDYIVGRIMNEKNYLEAICYDNSYIIYGSLAKFLYGNNIMTLDLYKIQDALTKLSDILERDISSAKVVSLEIGVNIPLTKPVEDYIKLLGEMPRIARHQYNRDSLYYKNDGYKEDGTKINPIKGFQFYNKGLEAKSKGVIIPKEFDESYLLRYEMRLYNRIPSQIGVPYLEASMLSDRNVFSTLVKMWQDAYFRIDKKKPLKIDLMDGIKTPRNALDTFVAWKLGQTDNDQIQEFIEGLKRAKAFKYNKDYTNLKKMFKRMQDKACISESNELIIELDEAIKKEAAKYIIV